MAALDQNNKAKSKHDQFNLKNIQKTVALITLFNRRPTSTEINRINVVKRRENRKAGLNTFNYSCTLPVADNIIGNNENLSPINSFSKPLDMFITKSSITGPCQFANLGCLIDSGNLFSDVISKTYCENLQIDCIKNDSRLQSANGKIISILDK